MISVGGVVRRDVFYSEGQPFFRWTGEIPLIGWFFPPPVLVPSTVSFRREKGDRWGDVVRRFDSGRKRPAWWDGLQRTHHRLSNRYGYRLDFSRGFQAREVDRYRYQDL